MAAYANWYGNSGTPPPPLVELDVVEVWVVVGFCVAVLEVVALDDVVTVEELDVVAEAKGAEVEITVTLPMMGNTPPLLGT